MTKTTKKAVKKTAKKTEPKQAVNETGIKHDNSLPNPEFQTFATIRAKIRSGYKVTPEEQKFYDEFVKKNR